MAKLSITEAAKRAGISRSKFYENYINKGVISVEQDSKGKPQIDTSELLRVFGELQGDTLKETIGNNQQDNNLAVLQERIKGLEALLTVKDEVITSKEHELQRYYERERALTHLLEDKSQKTKKVWWPWGKNRG